MTEPARIKQADIERALKAARAAGVAQARVVMDLAKQKIEIIIGESAGQEAAPEVWSDEDV